MSADYFLSNIESSVVVRNVPSIVLQTQPASSFELTNEWKTGVWGNGIGKSKVVLTDLSGDGIAEIVAGASLTTFGADTYWYVAGYEEDTKAYSQQWISAPIPQSDSFAGNEIASIAAADINGVNTVFVAETDGMLRAYTGWPLDQVAEASIPPEAHQMAAGDLDGDGTVELVIATDSSLHILDASTLVERSEIADIGGGDISIGQLDSDAPLEIVTSSGYVIDGVSLEMEWQYSDDFGSQVEVGNFDTDSALEIVGADAWDNATIFDPVDRSPIRDVPLDDIDSLDVADIDEDGIDEIVIGEGQWGSILFYDAQTGDLKKSINNPEHGVTDVSIADTDGDSGSEVVWGTGHSSTGADYLMVADLQTGDTEWQSLALDGPLAQLDVGDVDADGDLEIVIASFESESGYGSGIISVYDATSHALEWQSSQVVDGSAWTGVHQLRLGNIDGDPQLEIVIGTDQLYDGIVVAYDGLSHEIELETDYTNYGGAPVHSLAIGDANGDGVTDVVAGLGREHTGADGTYLVVFDAGTGDELWRSTQIGPYWGAIKDVAIADIDTDANPELIAATPDDGIRVFDGVTGLLDWHGGPTGARAIDIFDLDGDAKPELLVGDDDGHLTVYETENWAALWDIDLGGTIDAVRGITAGNGVTGVLVTSDGKLSVVDPMTKSVGWTSENLGGNLGLGNHLAFVPGGGTSADRVWLGSDFAAYEFALNKDAPGPENTPPVAEDDTAKTELNKIAQIDILANDSDADGDGLSVILVGDPEHGKVEINSDFTVTYTPAANFMGLDTFSYEISDGEASDTAIVVVDVVSGPNTLMGTDAGDTIVGRPIDDVVLALGGNDQVRGGRGNDWISGGEGDDDICGGRGDDATFGGDGDDDIGGGRGDDTIAGGDGDDDLRGGRGDDELMGGEGDDDISGGRNADLLAGGSGDDLLSGGRGNDTLTGGDDWDTFVFAPGDGHDIIEDFEQGEDVIDLTEFGLDGFASLETMFQEQANGTLIELSAEDQVLLKGIDLDILMEADFIL